MPNYEALPEALSRRMADDARNSAFVNFAFDDADALRRDPTKDLPTVIRTPFIRDIDKIMHCPYYGRYADKTQVFSFYKNDDLSRRSLHVQLVSRIARTIGHALHLNLDLIEAIALGHDIGHTPFGHAGERILDALLYDRAGLHFSHNIQSVRVLDRIFPYNITLQTLNGIAAHDGELELAEYRPKPLPDFNALDAQLAACTLDKGQIKKLTPCTLEGCVVRISDIIAYLGKDRQDAERAKIARETDFSPTAIGSINSEFINNLTVNIIENSYGKPYIRLDETHFAALQTAKAENYERIYKSEAVSTEVEQTVRPMMTQMYEKLLDDLTRENRESPVFTHHIRYISRAHYTRPFPYETEDPNRIVTDYIASMTDDYFLDLYAHLFPQSDLRIGYTGYFDKGETT